MLLEAYSPEHHTHILSDDLFPVELQRCGCSSLIIRDDGKKTCRNDSAHKRWEFFRYRGGSGGGCRDRWWLPGPDSTDFRETRVDIGPASLLMVPLRDYTRRGKKESPPGLYLGRKSPLQFPREPVRFYFISRSIPLYSSPRECVDARNRDNRINISGTLSLTSS